jgi:endonuclease YncB( thermonuclease family)
MSPALRPVALALAMGLSAATLLVQALTVRAVAEAVPPAKGSWFSGVAQVSDGDTLVVGDVKVRLEGIDAPESSQSCRRRFIGSWGCGQAATRAMMQLAEGREIVCESRGLDKYGRTLGFCLHDGRDIGGALVRQGLAWAFVKYSTRYVQEEAAARRDNLGVWQAETEAPWDFRAKRWAVAEGGSPNGCAIKGNVTANGRIYHMPWSPWYDRIRMGDGQGKRWFCDEAEAVAAGWRPAVTQ